MNSPISASEISIVVQGPVINGITEKCLDSVRTVFPQGEIILSTWKGSPTHGLEYDKLILSDDPGTVCVDHSSGAVNNINRQLISAQAGLCMVDRPYALKTRTDISFQNRDFLTWFRMYDELYPPKYVKNRILVCNYYTRNPRVFPLPFHVSDWLAFGNTEDIQNLYNAPLQSAEEDTWFLHNKRGKAIYINYLSRYVPEQHIFLSFLQKNCSVSCDCYTDCTQKNIRKTEQVFAETIVVLDYGTQLAIKFEKYNPNRYLEKYSLLSYVDWKLLCRKYYSKRYIQGWVWYCMKSFFCRCLARLRRGIVSLMDCFYVKEKFKNLLSKRSHSSR